VLEQPASHRHALHAAVAERESPAREDPRRIAQVVPGWTSELPELPAKAGQELLERREPARQQAVSMHCLGDTGTGRRRAFQLPTLDQQHFIADVREH